jgi:outer membrane protein
MNAAARKRILQAALPGKALLTLVTLLALPSAPVYAQATLRDADEIAADYVATALTSNIALQTRELEVDRAQEALRAARARFLPELAVSARYTRSDGGRTIDVPLGTLLNPAYQTLNEQLVAQGEQPRFAPIQDSSITFQREREQDTRLTLRQPLYQPAIPAATRAQRQLLRGAEASRSVLERQLRRDVTTAYLNWLMALRASTVLEGTREVLEENLRVNDSLLRNGRVTEDQVLRARTEQLAVRQQLRESASAIDQARNYVNFLLNRPLDTPLEDARIPAFEAVAGGGANGATGAAARATHSSRQMLLDAQQRPEVEQAAALVAAAREQEKVARAALGPSLALAFDAGTQGETYRFGEGNNFSSASLVFSWKFFDGGANSAERQRARIAARQARLQQDAIAQQVELEVRQALDRLAESTDSLAVAEARAEAARSALFIATRKRDAGAMSQVEFLDARNASTTAELALNVTRFQLLQRRVELEFAAGDGASNPTTP